MPLISKNGELKKAHSVQARKKIEEHYGRGKETRFVIFITDFHHSHQERKNVDKIIYTETNLGNYVYSGISGDNVDQALESFENMKPCDVSHVVISPYCHQVNEIPKHLTEDAKRLLSWETLVAQLKRHFIVPTERKHFRINKNKVLAKNYIIFNTTTKKFRYLSLKDFNEMETDLIPSKINYEDFND